MQKTIQGSLFAILLATASPSHACKAGDEAQLEVTCSRSSAFVNVNIHGCRRIGRVLLEVLDAKGTVLYREEGKALTPELIRRLDKGAFPRGPLTLKATAKDFSLSQDFTVE